MTIRRLFLVASLAAMLAVAPAQAAPTLLRFEGSAAVTLHEVVTHEEYGYDDVVRHPVRLTVEMTGLVDPALPYVSGTAQGWAEIAHADGRVVHLDLIGRISPPEGSGGTAYADAWDDNGDRYCFSIVDQSDAPTPRADQVVAMVESRDVFVHGYAQSYVDAVTGDPTNGVLLVPLSMCPALERLGGPVSGDYAFRTLQIP